MNRSEAEIAGGNVVVALWHVRDQPLLAAERRFPAHFRALAIRIGLRRIPCMDSHIVIDPAVCNGRPVVRGTRIKVQTVMEFLAAGDSVDEVLEGYPSLTREQVLTCME